MVGINRGMRGITFHASMLLWLLAGLSVEASGLVPEPDAHVSDRVPVAAITQFSDVQPIDWAYQALSNLIERYGCVAGYPNGTYRGQRAMTRFEAAALLNACLDRITEVTDELKRLMKEFEKELAVLKGRVDGLEAKVAELEATQFSTTTKLSGLATFVVGGNAFWGSAVNRQTNTVSRQIGYYRPMVALPDAATFSYDLQLNLDTSFTGADLLRLNLRAGNFGDSVFGGEPHDLALSELEIAFEEDCGSADCGHVVAVNKLFYQWPLGGGFTATLGPRVGQEDMLALWPNVYPSDAILNVMTVNGAPAAYSKNRGGGAGLWWERNGFSVSANYVAARADQGRPAQGGVANGFSGSTASLQLAYAGVQAGLALIWTRLQPDSGFVPGTTPFVHEEMDHNPAARTDAYGVSGYWQPMTSGWWPSLSVGWGMNQTRFTTAQPQGSLSTSQSWMVGLQWTDVFLKGNDFGFAVAQPVFATALTG
ncbi:MAG: hypothetical protein RLZZ216_2245, partial [Cyanobacteriota bacterium]